MNFREFMLLFLLSLHGSNSIKDYEIHFLYYIDNGRATYKGYANNMDLLEETKCKNSDKFAFIVPGSPGNCEYRSLFNKNENWVTLLRSELLTYRGGCIVCIDYGGVGFYLKLAVKFDELVKEMTRKISDLVSQGVNLTNTYMFGYSLGGRLALAIGKNFKQPKIHEMDICDGTEFGFIVSSELNHQDAADNVQCIHTSKVFGSKIYACHQNWRLGDCGERQPFFKCLQLYSHRQCPKYYLSAFENPFYAIEKPAACISKNPAKNWPEGFKMGYNESRKAMVRGELFARTSCYYPYNVIARTKSSLDLYTSNNSYDWMKKEPCLTLISLILALFTI